LGTKQNISLVSERVIMPIVGGAGAQEDCEGVKYLAADDEGVGGKSSVDRTERGTMTFYLFLGGGGKSDDTRKFSGNAFREESKKRSRSHWKSKRGSNTEKEGI